MEKKNNNDNRNRNHGDNSIVVMITRRLNL